MANKDTAFVLTLIECGATTWSREGRLLGSADLPLCESARAAAVTSAELLARNVRVESKRKSQIATIMHPSDEAATNTAGIYAEALGSKTRAVEAFSDPHLGLLEGLAESTFAERYPKRFKRWQDDPAALAPPEAEPLLDARDHFFAAFAKALRKSKTRELAVVLHQLNLGFLECWLADRPSSELWSAVKDRPLVTRFLMSRDMIEAMEQAATPEEVGA